MRPRALLAAFVATSSFIGECSFPHATGDLACAIDATVRRGDPASLYARELCTGLSLTSRRRRA